MLQNHVKAKCKIKIVFKYILILVVLPCLCTLMIPLFTALLPLTGLHKISQFAYLLLVLLYKFDVIACAASGFIIALLISALAKNKEIIMTLLGVLIVAIIYLGYNFYLHMSMYSNGMPEGLWKFTLLQMGISGISLLASALIGAWLVVKKKKKKTQTDNDQ